MEPKNISQNAPHLALPAIAGVPAQAPNHPAQVLNALNLAVANNSNALNNTPVNPQNPAQTALAGQTGNPSSSVSHRLTQYSAIRSTMYCKVPAKYRIFVMQADQKEKQKPSQPNLSKL